MIKRQQNKLVYSTEFIGARFWEMVTGMGGILGQQDNSEE